MTARQLRKPVLNLRVPKKGLGVLAIVTAIFLVSLSAQQTTAHPVFATFDADIIGEFKVSGANGESPLFLVQESGTGYETTLGGFTYTTYLLHNLARVPEGCGPDSSTAIDGFAVFTFADGQMRLERVSGTACFSFPIIELEEHWRIASGTGAYVSATGKLIRTYNGDVRYLSGTGDFSGSVKLQ